MKKIIIFLTATLLFSWCSFIWNNNKDSDILIEEINKLEQDLSWKIQELSWILEENILMKNILSWEVDIMKSLKLENDDLKEKLKECEKIGNTYSNNNSLTTKDRYRKIYSNNYSIYKKDNTKYEICLAWNNNVCINLFQYVWKFAEYYKTLLPKEDLDNLPSWWQPNIVSIIEWRKTWKCTLWVESNVCFNENSNGSLIMILSDQRWEWFHWWEYDPREILKSIDF
jgi:regulator of replication initiation timing